MNRRGFLAVILAAGSAPLVLRSGIARGILMPARPRRMANARIDVFSAAGILLASVPYDETLGGSADILRSGLADHCRIHGVPIVLEGILTRDIMFSSPIMYPGARLSITKLQFVGN